MEEIIPCSRAAGATEHDNTRHLFFGDDGGYAFQIV